MLIASLVRIATQIFSDQDDIDDTLSKVLGRKVRLMKASLGEPGCEEYWPDRDGLARRNYAFPNFL